MFRALFLLLAMFFLLMPSVASAEGASAVDREMAMMAIDSNSGSESLLCPEMVELGSLEDRARRLVTALLFATLATLNYETNELPPGDGARERSCDDVIQCFRVAGVHLLNFGTAPPGVSTQ